VINTPPIVRFGITGVNVILVAIWAARSIRRKSMLQKVRTLQIKEHASPDKPD
jgi:hypothetical protein